MSGGARPAGSRPPRGGAVVLATAVGAAAGSRAVAAALACSGAEPERSALLIECGDSAVARPALLATVGARALEERLAAHLPQAAVASRGRICLLSLRADPDCFETAAAALPLARDSTAVIHLPARLLRPALEESRLGLTGALLRADLDQDRALVALVAGDLIQRGLRVAVLKRPFGWLTARRALIGAPPGDRGLPPWLRRRLLADPSDAVV